MQLNIIRYDDHEQIILTATLEELQFLRSGPSVVATLVNYPRRDQIGIAKTQTKTRPRAKRA